MTDPALPDETSAPPTGSLQGGSGRIARRLFLSYRRRDSQGATGRLYDGLARTFDKSAIFRDVATLAPGVEFDHAIAQALAESVVVIVVIGPRWVEMLQRFGTQPGDGPVDFVRLEVQTALERGAFIVPVLVDGAAPLTEAELPEPLRPLAKRQAHELSDRRWDHDLQVLLRHLAPRLQPAATPWPRIRRAVWVPTALIAIALYATALLWPVQTAPPISLGGGLSLQALAPGLSGRVDGGWVLLAAATLAALWRLLAGRVSSVVAGGVDAWWRDRHVLAAVAGGLAAAAPALVVGRPLFALGALATAGLFAAARRRLARWIDGTPRAATLMAALLAVPGLGLGIDVWADERRQADYDVALLLPPEGDRPGDEAAEVFRAFRTELTLALAGLPVDIAPPRLGPQERQQLDLTRPQTLLDYKGPRGAARVFIRIRYKLDENQQPSQVVVSPYFRQRSLADHLQVASDWAPRPLVGPAPIDLLALRAAFELIDYLSRSDRLRLNAAELAQAWRQLLQEYKQVLFFNAPAACASLIREVDASSLPGANPQAERVRDLVFRRCDDPGPIAPDSAEETARAVYSAVVRP